MAKWTERFGHDDILPTPMNKRSMNFLVPLLFGLLLTSSLLP